MDLKWMSNRHWKYYAAVIVGFAAGMIALTALLLGAWT